MTFKYYSTLFALLLTASISAQKLSRTEKKIVSAIEKNNSDAIDFLEKVVNINSGTLNAEGVKKVGMVFKDAFDNIGFETKWIEMPAEMNRSGHLFAETSGSKGKNYCLLVIWIPFLKKIVRFKLLKWLTTVSPMLRVATI